MKRTGVFAIWLSCMVCMNMTFASIALINHAHLGGIRASGTVHYLSDTPQIPNLPYDTGYVVFMAEAHLNDSAEQSKYQGIAIVNQGVFDIALDPGRYVICVANLGQQPLLNEVSLLGCAESRALMHDTSFELMWGEGGLSAVVQSYSQRHH
ncbi:hypothetical protein [Echinimonas agarilytica]|uniref:Carboxypeptidase regulatory-like domain-containing protein n=1 Tax=Echinimonas agarilytica TaxID=1215918 RepID=A0AA41W8P5_9GAMM|nr:hypothetical protein [Echinimonas agarilytica]MCM2680174.1 hypothetical protein [Echinimonas agarilytica]